MTNVAHLLLGAADQVAGIQKYIASLKGEYVFVVINRASQYEKYLRERKIKYYVFKNIRDLLAKLRSQEITVLHCHLGRAARVGFCVSFFLPLRLVYTQHFINPAYTLSHYAFFGRGYFRFIFRRFSKIIAISQAVADGIAARREVPRTKIAIIHNGIAISGKQTRRYRRCIVMICRMQKEKQPGLVLRLAELLPEYSFDVLGGGALLDSLRRSAPENCHFRGFQKNIDRYISGAQFLFMPAPAEPFGYVFLEALRLGVPVLAKRGGATGEILSAQCAYFFDERTLPALAKKIRETTMVQWQRLSAAAYVRVQRFSLQRMKLALREVYRQC